MFVVTCKTLQLFSVKKPLMSFQMSRGGEEQEEGGCGVISGGRNDMILNLKS